MTTIASVSGPRRRLWAAALPVALAAACAAGGGAGAGGAGKAAAPAADERSASAQGQGQFTPSKPAAPAYGADVGRCPTGGVFAAVLDELQGAAKRAGRQPPTADGRVCAVAEAFLRWDASAGTPRPEVLAFVSHWFGLPAAVAPPSIAVIETEDVRILAERIVQATGNSIVNSVYPRIGIVSQRVRRDATKVSVVLFDSAVEIDPPFPRRLELGQKATLTGRLVGGLTSPRLQVSDATGALSTPQQAPGTAFKADIACGDRPGRILVDIRGELESRAGVVASFPVACGMDPPAAVGIAPEPWPTEVREAEKRIFDLVNQERATAGLPPLVWDDGVAGVARKISQVLAESGGTGGVDVADRLKQEGIASPLVLQSAAAERSFARAHERLVSSPSNRANIMSREVNALGIGAVVQPDAQGRPLTYVTELFIQQLPPVDVAKVRDQLRAAVAQKRKDARTTAITSQPALDETAQEYAEALAAAGGTLPKERQTELTAPLNKVFKAVTMVSGAKPEPLDFAEEPQVTVPGKSLGVGVAQGRHPVLGRNAVYVVLMIGTPRTEAGTPAGGAKGSRKAPAPKASPRRAP